MTSNITLRKLDAVESYAINYEQMFGWRKISPVVMQNMTGGMDVVTISPVLFSEDQAMRDIMQLSLIAHELGYRGETDTLRDKILECVEKWDTEANGEKVTHSRFLTNSDGYARATIEYTPAYIRKNGSKQEPWLIVNFWFDTISLRAAIA